MNKSAKTFLLTLLALVVFIISFVGFALYTMPMNALNQTQFAGIQPRLSGTLSQGQFHGITIVSNSKTLSADCQWQKTGLLDFSFSCAAPLSLTGHATLNIFNQQLTIRDLLAEGELKALASWLSELNIPNGLSGAFSGQIDKATLTKGVLTHLALTGEVVELKYHNQLVSPLVSISTPKQQHPIIINTKASGNLRLFLESTIEDNRYHTQGEVSAKNLHYFKHFLNFMGRQTSHDTWTIDMRGQLL